MNIEIGSIIPVLIESKLQYVLILNVLKENRHIIENYALKIYKALVGEKIIFIDETLIYNTIKYLQRR